MALSFEEIVGGSTGKFPKSQNELLTGVIRALLQIYNDGIPSSTGTIPAVGQAFMAASLPVVLAADQSIIPVEPNVSFDAGTVDAATQRVVLEQQSRDDLTNQLATLTSILGELVSGIRLNIDGLGSANELVVGDKTILGNYLTDKNAAPLLLNRVGTNPGVNQVWAGGMTTMSVAAVNGNFEICQSYQRHPYYTGKTQLIEITFALFNRENLVEKEVGYYQNLNYNTPYNDVMDGIRLFVTGTDEILQVMNNGSVIASASRIGGQWDEPLDGTNPDAPVLNLTKFSIMAMDFLYLGGSTVRFGFRINGKVWWVWKYHHSNNGAGLIMQSPSHPVRWAIRSIGGAGSIRQICAAVSSIGSRNKVGYRFSTPPPAAILNANNAGIYYLIQALRLNTTSGKNSVLLSVDFGGLTGTADDLYLAVILNPTIAGVVVWNAVANSNIQYANGDYVGNPSTTTVTGGTILFSAPVSQIGRSVQSSIDEVIRLGISTDGVGDIVAYCLMPNVNGTNADVSGNLTYIEN